MKKILSFIFVTLLLLVTGCSKSQNTKIDGMNIKYESSNHFDNEFERPNRNYGVIEGNDIVLYIVASSPIYTPSVEDLDKEDGGVLDVEIDFLYSKDKNINSPAVEVYWKITIDSSDKYVQGIRAIEIDVDIERV